MHSIMRAEWNAIHIQHAFMRFSEIMNTKRLNGKSKFLGYLNILHKIIYRDYKKKY